MERMEDGQDTRARWKSSVLSLPREQSSVYLRDVEGYEPERIERLLEGDDAAIVPADWDVTEESKKALARYEAWERSAAGPERRAAQGAYDEYQEARGAALPPQEGLTQKSAMAEEVHE